MCAGNVETKNGPVSDPQALQPNQHTVQDHLSVSDAQAMMPNKMLAMAACNREAINGPVSDPHALMPNQAVLPSVHHPFRPCENGIANAAITDECAGNVETKIGPVSDPQALQPNQYTES